MGLASGKQQQRGGWRERNGYKVEVILTHVRVILPRGAGGKQGKGQKGGGEGRLGSRSQAAKARQIAVRDSPPYLEPAV